MIALLLTLILNSYAGNSCSTVFTKEFEYEYIYQKANQSYQLGQKTSASDFEFILNLFQKSRSRGGLHLMSPGAGDVLVVNSQSNIKIDSIQLSRITKSKVLIIEKSDIVLAQTIWLLDKLTFSLYSQKLVFIQGAWYRPTVMFSLNTKKHKLVSFYIYFIPVEPLKAREIHFGGLLGGSGSASQF